MKQRDRWFIGSGLKIVMDLLILILLAKAGRIDLDEEHQLGQAMGMVDAFNQGAGLWATGELPGDTETSREV